MNTITVKQVQKASKKARRNGFFLVKIDGKTIGSIEKPWHTNDYKVECGKRGINFDFQTYSTKQQAVDHIINHNSK